MTGDSFTLPDGIPIVPKKRVKILSLSGGGYRGLFTAKVIQRLDAERQIAAGPGATVAPFGASFDLIAGTSIGGILGAGLSCGVTGQQLVCALQASGSKIFPAMWARGLRKLIGIPVYDPEPLRDVIESLISVHEQKLSAHKAPLLVTAVNWTTSRLHLLGSGGTPVADPLGLTLMDAMLATSAAPAHFPPHVVGHHVFVDGGLAANAPDLLALQMARAKWPGSDIYMLSIGTANPMHGRDPSKIPRRGLKWAKPLLEIVMNAQEMRAIEDCERLMGCNRYLRLNFPPSAAQEKKMDFDVANPTSTQLLMTLADQCVDDIKISGHRLILADLLN